MPIRKRETSILVVAIVLALAPSQSFGRDVMRGRRMATLYCAGCHSIDGYTRSPLRVAPPFRTLHTRYPVESLEEAFAEGIVTGHPSMPQFRFDPDQIDDFIAFLKTFEQPQ